MHRRHGASKLACIALVAVGPDVLILCVLPRVEEVANVQVSTVICFLGQVHSVSRLIVNIIVAILICSLPEKKFRNFSYQDTYKEQFVYKFYNKRIFYLNINTVFYYCIL